MKLIYISYTILPSILANSIHIIEMCQSFANNGHEVVLLSPLYKNRKTSVDDIYQFYGVQKKFKIRLLNVPEIKGKSVYYALRCIKFILKFKPDIVYGRYDLGCLSGALFGFNTIYESHMPLSQSILDRCTLFLLTKSKSFVNLILITRQLKKEYEKIEWLKKELIRVVPDGAKRNYRDKKKINLPGRASALKVGYVGHLYKGKGVEVIEHIAGRMEDIDFHIIGGYAEDLQRWKTKISCNNVYFHGFIERNMVQNYIDSMDICLLPNQKYIKCVSESNKNFTNISDYTSPLKLFEYMAHEKPIIASDLPAIREILNKDNSILVKYNDYNGWIDAINKLRSNEIREKISKCAYSDFIKYYTWEKRAENVLRGISL